MFDGDILTTRLCVTESYEVSMSITSAVKLGRESRAWTVQATLVSEEDYLYVDFSACYVTLGVQLFKAAAL